MTTKSSSVIEFPLQERNLHNSVFIFIDLQMEYLSTGRAYALEDVQRCLENCNLILSKAREYGLTIVHFRSLMPGTFFNQGTVFAKWIERFSPRPNEMVFEHKQPSIYSNQDFAAFIDQIDEPDLVAVGLTGDRSCLSTAVESKHRNYKLTYITDASATPSIGGFSESESHEFVTNIISQYSKVMSTQSLLSNIENTQEFAWV